MDCHAAKPPAQRTTRDDVDGNGVDGNGDGDGEGSARGAMVKRGGGRAELNSIREPLSRVWPIQTARPPNTGQENNTNSTRPLRPFYFFDFGARREGGALLHSLGAILQCCTARHCSLCRAELGDSSSSSTLLAASQPKAESSAIHPYAHHHHLGQASRRTHHPSTSTTYTIAAPSPSHDAQLLPPH